MKNLILSLSEYQSGPRQACEIHFIKTLLSPVFRDRRFFSYKMTEFSIIFAQFSVDSILIL